MQNSTNMNTPLPPKTIDPERRRRAINNKARGKNLERKVVNIAQIAGIFAQRAWGSNGRALGLAEDVDVVIGTGHFQCKKTKKLRKDFQLNDHLTGVIIEGDRTEPVVLVRFSELLKLMTIKTHGTTG